MRYIVFAILMMASGTTYSQSGSFPGNFVHSVYFWLNNPDSQEDKEEFLKNLNAFLESSKYLTSYHVAPPAETPREVVDNSYDYNLVVTFDTKEAQDKYQTEAAHLTFIETSDHLWDRVRIYDSYRNKEDTQLYKRGDIQVGVIVSDRAASENFYTEVVGMVKAGEFSVPPQMAKTAGLTDGVALEVSVMKLRNEPHASEWKLMQFSDAPEPVKSTHINQGSGMRYVTFFVSDMNAVMDRLKANNITMLGETPMALGEDQLFILIQDPDGIFIELIGPKP